MKKYLILTILLISFNSCEKLTNVQTTHAIGEVTTIFVVNGNKSAVVGWKAPGDVSVIKYYLHRDTINNFAVKNSNRIGIFTSIPAKGFKDTQIENNKNYYYTIVTESMFDGAPFFSAPHFYAGAVGQDYSILKSSDINYTKHIQQIFNSGCAVSGCHIGTGAILKTQKKLHGGVFSLKSWNDLIFNNNLSATVIPYRANKSHLIYHLNRDTSKSPISKPMMPSEEIILPEEQIETLMEWIDSGAKNDLGETAFNSIAKKGNILITSQGEDLVSILNLDYLKITRVVTSGVENVFQQTPMAPHNVTIDRANKHYYVNLIGGSKILKFNVLDNTKIGEFKTEINSPAQVSLSFTGDTALVTNFEGTSKTITVFNTRTMEHIKTIADPAILKPHGISIAPNNKIALSANSFSDNITFINLSDLSVEATIPVSKTVPELPINYQFQFEPYQIVIDSKSKFGYVTCKKSGEIRVIDIEQRKIIDSIKVGDIPLIPAISNDDMFVYIPNRNSNSLSVLETSTRKIIKTIETIGQQPHGVAVSNDGKMIIVTLENLINPTPEHHPTTGSKRVGKVVIIDANNFSILKEFEVGNYAAGIASTFK